ncbi:MAG: ABC transporter ATP-binding protein [Solirubrobacteraceae bacterium]
MMPEDPLVRVCGVSKTYTVRRQALPAPIPGLPWRRRSSEPQPGWQPDPVDDDEDDEVDDPEQELVPPSGPVVALDDVSFESYAGEGLAVLGADGSGKSTLLRILARITSPSDGTVELRGRAAPLFAIASGLMKPDRTGTENVRHLGRFHGLSPDLVDDRMARIFGWADMEGLEHQPVKKYSGGMYQRLAFSIMVNLSPDIILADGTIAVGDKPFRRRCGARLQECVEEGVALILATQDPSVARRFCTRAVWLREGRVVTTGPIGDVADAYERSQDPERPPERAVATGPATIAEFGIFASDGTPLEVLARDEPALLRAWIEIWNAGVAFQTIFVLEGNASRARVIQPSLHRSSETGRHEVETRLPPGTLPGGRYTVRVGARIDSESGPSTIKRPGNRVLEVLDEDEESPIEPRTLRQIEASLDLDWDVALLR